MASLCGAPIARENMPDLSLAERDVLRVFWRVRPMKQTPHVRDLQAALGCRHSAHLPGIVVSLIRKGYLRDAPAMSARGGVITGMRYGHA